MNILKRFNRKTWIMIGVITALLVFGIDHYQQTQIQTAQDYLLDPNSFYDQLPTSDEPKANSQYTIITMDIDGKGTTIPPPGEHKIPLFTSDDPEELKKWDYDWNNNKTTSPPPNSSIAIQAYPITIGFLNDGTPMQVRYQRETRQMKTDSL